MIISFILLTCMFHQVVVLLGEIRCRSLLGPKIMVKGQRDLDKKLFPRLEVQRCCGFVLDIKVLKGTSTPATNGR